MSTIESPPPAAASFSALVIRRDEATASQSVGIERLNVSDLMDGDVTVRVDWSSLNYKDALAITAKAPVVRRFPMVPGVDFAGPVIASENGEFAPGDQVILNGWGVGERHFGGHAGMARVPGDWLIRQPEGLLPEQAMALGTAGYTAMLAVMALERAGVTPAAGPVAVSGAAGGVGSVAIVLLAALGVQVSAITGRASEEGDYLRGLGATEIVDRAEFSGPSKPLATERWAGAVDAVGGTVLANLLSATKYGGAVAACGNAAGMELATSVAPFILRGVSLLGIDSVRQPRPVRVAAWARLGHLMDIAKLDAMTRTIGLQEVETTAHDMIARRTRGRILVKLGDR